MVNLCLRLWRRTKDRGKGTKQQQDTSANAGVTSEKGNKMAAEIAQAAPATLPEPTSSNGNRNGASDTEITTATPATTLFNGTRANGDVAVDQTDSDEEVDRESLISDILDSSYETDSLNTSQFYDSLESGAYNFPVKNGRTYHGYQEGKYLMPNDEREQDRMDMVYHSMNKMLEDRLFFAPVKNPHRIADMATGTGIWAIDVGDKYKSAQVVGVDLSPIQPRWVPPNVQFRVDDIDKDWCFEHPLDLVHSRVCSGNAIRDWQAYLRKAMAALKPGGWVEAQEFDMAVQDDHDSFPDKSMIKIWHKEVERSFRKAGCEMRITGTQLKNYMEGAGFVNVHVQEYKWPMSPWPEDDRLKEAGAFAMLSMLEDIEAISLASLTGFGGWKKKEVDIFVESTKTEWKTKGPKGYWWLYVVYGQKPELPKRDVSEESEAAPTAVGNGNGQS